MKKTERIALNIAALAVAHVIIMIFQRITSVFRLGIIINYLLTIAYFILLTQMIYRNKVVFSSQLFDSETPWYKQLGITKVIILFFVDVAITFSASSIMSIVLMFTPRTDETVLAGTVIWNYTITWMSHLVFYIILAGKEVITHKKTALLMAGFTLVVAAVFCVGESSMRVNSIGNQFTIYQYLEIINNANNAAIMQRVFRFIMACSLVVFHELWVVGKDGDVETAADSELSLSSDDNEDDKDIDGEDISPADYADDEGDIIEDSLSEDN